jgi:hypothetical protein
VRNVVLVAVEVAAGEARERRERGERHDETKEGALADHAAILSGELRPQIRLRALLVLPEFSAIAAGVSSPERGSRTGDPGGLVVGRGIDR